MAIRPIYPKPDMDIEPPGKPVGVEEKAYREITRERQHKESPDKRPLSNYYLSCNAYKSTVKSYPLNLAECELSYLSGAILMKFYTNTTADQTKATKTKNPKRDPLKEWGDTPVAIYDLNTVRLHTETPDPQHNGPYFNMSASADGSIHDRKMSSIELHAQINKNGILTPSNGCFGTHRAELEKLVDILAGTDKGDLAGRIKKANALLQTERVRLHFNRNLPEVLSTQPKW